MAEKPAGSAPLAVEDGSLRAAAIQSRTVFVFRSVFQESGGVEGDSVEVQAQISGGSRRQRSELLNALSACIAL